MRRDRVSNLGSLALESDALPTAFRFPAKYAYCKGSESTAQMRVLVLNFDVCVYIKQSSCVSRSNYVYTAKKSNRMSRLKNHRKRLTAKYPVQPFIEYMYHPVRSSVK